MRLEKLDLNLLVPLESLLQTQSVTETAKQLNVSQPTISAALRRLREYFDDELLIQIGRVMTPTSKAAELAPAVTELMNIARFRIVQSEFFDPATSTRRFRIIASDYIFDVLLADTMAKISSLAPNVQIEILPIAQETVRQFDRGEFDLMISVRQFMLEGHPSKEFYRDEDAVVAWNEGRFAEKVTRNQFKNAEFATVTFGADGKPGVSELHFKSMGLQLTTVVHVPSFSALPGSVVGTDRLAIMHRKHAEIFKAVYPIAAHRLPIEGPVICQVAQWHRLRKNDHGILWLLGHLETSADALRTA